jgi:hypothetical protein
VGIKTGVPQGSVLGPLLFLVYINDISNATNALGNVLFADDTNLPGELDNFFRFIGGRHIKPTTIEEVANLSTAINAKLALVVEWLKINKLSLNTTKTKYMLFHLARQKMEIYESLKLIMDGNIIERTNTFNMLGLTINTTLTWKDHTEKIASKVGSAIGVMYRMRYTLSKKAIMSLYNALILSHLHYCNLLWGHTPGRLEGLQKKALRVITGSAINTHSKQLCNKLGTLLLDDIHHQKLLCLYKKVVTHLVPKKIKVIFDDIIRIYKNFDTSITRSKLINLKYELPYTLKTTRLKGSMEYMEGLTRCVSFTRTKKKIKEEILSRYPTTCPLMECNVCNYIAEDASLPARPTKAQIKIKNKNARDRKKQKTQINKPPCPPNCRCWECIVKHVIKNCKITRAQAIRIVPDETNRHACPTECYCEQCKDRTRKMFIRCKELNLPPATMEMMGHRNYSYNPNY